MVALADVLSVLEPIFKVLGTWYVASDLANNILLHAS